MDGAAISTPPRRHTLTAAMALMSLALGPGAARAQLDAAISDPVAGPMEVAPQEPPSKADFEAATRPDQIGRIVVPVMVNGEGPFLFVLDTGANRTVVTPGLISALGLQTTKDDSVTMQGATGSAVVPTAIIARIAAGDVLLVNQQLPVADSLAIGIDGILGVDTLEDKRIEVDFKTGRIEIRNARHQRPIEGAARIDARLRFGRLMVVDALVNHTRVKAVIDTGSQYTLGNFALQEALYDPVHDAAPNLSIDVLGESMALQRGERKPVSTLAIGDVRAGNFSIVFGDFYVFKLWDLERRPAIIIGMDLIGSLETLAIDYERREVQFVPRKS